MNKDLSGLTQEADPQEVIMELKKSLKEKEEVISDLRRQLNEQDKQPMAIPEEVKKWIAYRACECAHDVYEHKKSSGLLGNGYLFSDMEMAAKATAEAVYDRLAPEIASLKTKRDAYRKALEEIVKLSNPYKMFDAAKDALDQYPSPEDKDNE